MKINFELKVQVKPSGLNVGGKLKRKNEKDRLWQKVKQKEKVMCFYMHMFELPRQCVCLSRCNGMAD